ncbi:MAG TPA: protein kinase [Pyrinomonadaceae bacterium]|nr:protein kinase [Pyrinomonadaceae bacterium]
MDIERWRQVEEILDSALDVPEPAERARLLDRACAGDTDLRAEVESLLAHHAPSESFIESPAYAFAPELLLADDGADDKFTNRRAGPYKIIREIGRGGMGAVFLAERADGEFTQEVALKVVRRGFADPELDRRFRRERQILASLNHPNIARLLDGGVSEDGEPYLVMEYVEGARIDDYCDGRSLARRARLRLFIEVCSAVSYAHQRLVVHRDIKPSNILVNGGGVPKLLDFGIAKLLDPEFGGEQTRTELRAFTPDYASPEQIAGGQITTASDVYSLGVLLRDLLRGTNLPPEARRGPGGWRSPTPSDRKTVAANLPTDEEGTNRKGRTRSRGFNGGGELENIVAMARHEDPARRYASASQLAEDVQRYLDGLPVRAQRDSFTYRAAKFVRRNRVGVAAAAIVLLTLLGGVAATIWQARRATQQARVAARERDRAERRFADVRQLSNALLSDIAPRIERLPGATEARQAVLTQSLKYLDSLAREAAGDFELQGELATAYEKVGDLQGNPNNPNLVALTDALASYEKAQAMRRALLGQSPRDFERRLLLANNHRALGDIRWQTNEPTESLRNAEAAISLYGELLSERPHSVEARRGLVRSLLDAGQVRATNEQYREAISSFRRAIALLSDAPDGRRGEVEHALLLAEAHKQLGNSLSWDGRQPEAEAEMARAVALSESLFAANPHDNRLRTALYQTYMMTSSVYEEVNDPLSNEYAFKALKIISEAVERDPADVRAGQQLAKAYSRLGVTLDNTGRGWESVLYLGKAVRILRGLADGEAKNRRLRYDLATAYIRLGDAEYRQRNFHDSLDALGRAAAVLTELSDADATDNASLRNLANAAESMAKAHEGLAARAAGVERQSRRQMARQNYQRASDILLRLEAGNTLSRHDRKALDKLQAVLQKYERGG